MQTENLEGVELNTKKYETNVVATVSVFLPYRHFSATEDIDQICCRTFIRINDFDRELCFFAWGIVPSPVVAERFY